MKKNTGRWGLDSFFIIRFNSDNPENINNKILINGTAKRDFAMESPF